MKVSPLRTEFFAQSTIDKDNMTVPERESCGWLLSSPLTTIFSRIHIGSPPSSQQLETEDIMGIECRAVACQVSSKDFPNRSSISTDSSEESDGWVIEDLFDHDGANSSLGNSHSSYGSTLSQLEDEEKIWSLWDANKDIVSPDPFYHASKPIRARRHAQPCASRKLPSQIQHELLDLEHNSHLKRCPALRSPPRNTPTEVPQAPPPLPTAKYSPFPPTSIPANPEPNQDYHMKYHSWPLPTEPQVKPQLRSRAYTTPMPTTRSIRKVSRPSNLSSCTTLNYNSPSSPSGSSMPMYIRSTPSSPTFAPPPERHLMDMMVETSAFSDDEDDEEEKDVPTFVLAMKSVLQLGRGHSAIEAEKLPEEKAKRKAPRRSLTGALNSLFKMKKGATL